MVAPSRTFTRAIVERAQLMYEKVCERDGNPIEGWGALTEEERTVYLIAAWLQFERTPS